jgi:hypothetical protein
MTDEISIQVTPNVQKCLEELTAAVTSLPAGDLKERAEGAIQYLSQTFKGQPQPQGGRGCPGGSGIIR